MIVKRDDPIENGTTIVDLNKAPKARAGTRILLTPAQVSALECRGIDELDDSPEVSKAWDRRRHLTVPANEGAATLLLEELIEHSNGEDAQAEMEAGTETGKLAGRAARSFNAICSKVVKAIIEARPEERA